MHSFKQLQDFKFFAIIIMFLLPLSISATSPLQPIRLDHPRDTMKSYMEAMSDYKRGLTSEKVSLIERLNDAARCFDLSGFPPTHRTQKGREVAVLLKEVLDRVIVINLQLIPDDSQSPQMATQRHRDHGSQNKRGTQRK